MLCVVKMVHWKRSVLAAWHSTTLESGHVWKAANIAPPHKVPTSFRTAWTHAHAYSKFSFTLGCLCFWKTDPECLLLSAPAHSFAFSTQMPQNASWLACVFCTCYNFACRHFLLCLLFAALERVVCRSCTPFSLQGGKRESNPASFVSFVEE